MDEWTLSYQGFDSDEEGLREALCTLGNGYFASRGTVSEARADGVHYPGTYLAGGYNRRTTSISGREVENEDLVNLPNWLRVEFRVPGGEWFRLQDVHLLEYELNLNLKQGMLYRAFRFEDEEGRLTRVKQERLVSMRSMHLAALHITWEAENDSPNRYKVSKQADVLMLFYLLSSEELRDIFEKLDYPFEYRTIPDTIDYYMKRTSHGSTLSRVVHSWVLARSDRKQSWELFTKALESDIRDIQGGTTPEGIHLGAMAGTVELIQRSYSGIEPRGSVLWFNPRLPDALEELHMDIRFRGHSLALDITRQTLKVSSNRCREKPVRIGFQGEEHSLEAGGSLTFQIQNQV